MLTTVIFDLDQTLLDRDATFKLFLSNQHIRLEKQLQNATSEEFYTAVKSYDNNGYSPKSEVYAKACKDLNLAPEIAEMLLDDFKQHYGNEPILFDDTHDVLTKLQNSYKLALITNGGTRGQNAKIDNAKLRDYFDCIVVSETEGIKKPDIRIFALCLGRLGITAKDAVYIGDNPENDVRAAQLCGLKAIWKRNANYPEIDYANAIVDSLSKVPEVLSAL